MTRRWMLFEVADRKSNAFLVGLPISVIVVVNLLYPFVKGRPAKESFDL